LAWINRRPPAVQWRSCGDFTHRWLRSFTLSTPRD